MSDKSDNGSGVTRRDFLGLAAFGAGILGVLGAIAGSLRLMKPNVRYEESTKFKIGMPDSFPEGTFKNFDEKKVFISSDNDGIYAISSVCTHLGCLVYPVEWGFQCPCHGSKYTKDGKVIGGPAPRPLPWFEINQEVDGTLVVDTARAVPEGTKYIFS